MNQLQQNLEDINFITERIIFFLNLIQDPPKLRKYFEENRTEALFSLQHPDRGMLICGIEAHNRFYSLGKRWLDAQKDKNARTHLDELVAVLKELYVRKFLVSEDPIDERNVQKFLSAAYKCISKKRQRITHFIPCSLFVETDPRFFIIGPAKFLCQEEFMARYQNKIESCRKRIQKQNQQLVQDHIDRGFPRERAMRKEDSAKLADHLVDSVYDFFSDFSWIAIVSIDPCDENVSRNKAFFAVNAALNILKLLIGRSHTDRIRIAYAPGSTRQNATLAQVDNGDFRISTTQGGDENFLGEDWHAILHEKVQYYWEQASKALTLCMDFDERPYLAVRFIDAIRWYGDGVSETDPAYQIVKYISALERITGTGLERNEDGTERGVTEIVTTRSAILYREAEGIPFEKAQSLIKKLYALRSDLLHGSISPFDPSIRSFTGKAEMVTRLTLLMGLNYYSAIGLADPTMNETKLKHAFRKLERQAKGEGS